MRRKEHHFFDGYLNRDFNQSDIERYHIECSKPKDRVSGEWTPSYMVDAWVPPLLKRSAPDTKLIVVLRDPIERLISGISFSEAGIRIRQRDSKSLLTSLFNALKLSRLKLRQVKHIENSTSLNISLNRRIASVQILRGYYYQHMTRWRRYFSDSSILVIQYEKLVRNPRAGIKLLYNHIGVDTGFIPAEEIINRRFKQTQESNKIRIPDFQRNCLVKEYRNDVQKLTKLYPSIDLDLWPNFATLHR